MENLNLANQPKDDRGRVRVWAIPEGRWRWVEPVDAREQIARGAAVLNPSKEEIDAAAIRALESQREVNPILVDAQKATALKAAEAEAEESSKALTKAIADQKAAAKKLADEQAKASQEDLKLEAAAQKAAEAEAKALKEAEAKARAAGPVIGRTPAPPIVP